MKNFVNAAVIAAAVNGKVAKKDDQCEFKWAQAYQDQECERQWLSPGVQEAVVSQLDVANKIALYGQDGCAPLGRIAPLILQPYYIRLRAQQGVEDLWGKLICNDEGFQFNIYRDPTCTLQVILQPEDLGGMRQDGWQVDLTNMQYDWGKCQAVNANQDWYIIVTGATKIKAAALALSSLALASTLY